MRKRELVVFNFNDVLSVLLLLVLFVSSLSAVIVGWSVVCDFGISCSNSLFFVLWKLYKRRILHECSCFIEFIKQVEEKR